MENDRTEETTIKFLTRDISFVARALVITVMITGSISFLLQQSESTPIFEKPVNRVLLLALISNPEGLIISSEYNERKGNFDRAYEDTRLAIGLMEMHNGDRYALERYKKRADTLKSKIKN